MKYLILVLQFLLQIIYCQENNSKFVVDKLAEGFQFVEGPLWMNGKVLFSDIPANIIYEWTPEKGISEFLNPSRNSNGLALDSNGNLLIAQHGKRRLVRIDNNGTENVLAAHYDGKRLNSPNDLTVHSDGSIFFTDPPYGIKPEDEELGFYGIYKIMPAGKLFLLDSSLYRPNGIALSPDESKLYVSDSRAQKIFVWDILNDTTITGKRELIFMYGKGSSDGMKMGKNGLLYSTGPFGIWVIDQKGVVLDTIFIPGQTTNCNWGKEENTLFVTSGGALYRVSLEKNK